MSEKSNNAFAILARWALFEYAIFGTVRQISAVMTPMHGSLRSLTFFIIWELKDVIPCTKDYDHIQRTCVSGKPEIQDSTQLYCDK